MGTGASKVDQPVPKLSTIPLPEPQLKPVPSMGRSPSAAAYSQPALSAPLFLSPIATPRLDAEQTTMVETMVETMVCTIDAEDAGDEALHVEAGHLNSVARLQAEFGGMQADSFTIPNPQDV